MAYIEVVNNTKTFPSGDETIYANKDISFEVEKGQLMIILGTSGAGKSTLLNILGGMDTNTSGDVIIDGQNIAQETAKQLTAYRRNDVGFVFQFYNLVPNLTALENVELAAQIVPDHLPAEEALKSVGLEKRLNNFPAQLSGGSNSGSPSPGRSPRNLSSCCVTSRPGRWTLKPAAPLCKSSRT